VVLTCSDYFKSTGVLTLQPAAPKAGGGFDKTRKRDRRRKNVVAPSSYRQRELFWRKTKKKSLALKKVDIKDSFRHANMDGGNVWGARAKSDGGTRFVDRSAVVKSRTKPAADGGDDWKQRNRAGGNARAFSVINVNDIIRDTGALLKF